MRSELFARKSALEDAYAERHQEECERTTWCKSIAKERRTGYRVTHRLGKTPVPLKRGDRLLLLVEPKNAKLGRAGEIELVAATSTLLAAMAGASSVYQWNEVTPAK